MSNSIGAFLEGIKEYILNFIKNMLIDGCTLIYNSMFSTINNKINEAGTTLGQSPEDWSGGAFNLIKSISENAIFPIAGIIITYVFCYEILHLLTESNSMKMITPKDLLMTILKSFLAILILSNSFKIVMAFFEVGNYLTKKVSASNVNVGNTVDISSVLASESVMGLAGALCLLGIAWLITYFLAIAIYVAVNAWFLEIFIYSSVAAIPFATFMNKDWGQMGHNYARKVMALALQSFFMLLCLMIYGTRLSDVANGDLIQKLMEIVGGGMVLVFTLFKCGNISSSICNAH